MNGEINTVVKRLHDQTMTDLAEGGGDPLSVGEKGVAEWAEAREISRDELEAMLQGKRPAFMLMITMDLNPWPMFCAMGMYAFQLGFEVAAERYLKEEI